MVKKLMRYTNLREIQISEGRGIFKGRIKFENGSYYLYYLDRHGYIDESKPPRKIYANGKKRISKIEGVLTVGHDRKWKKLVEEVLKL